MKLLIFSDNHRDKQSVEKMISLHKDADRIISLGDSEMREHELTNLNVFGVKGNYPFEPKFPNDLIFVFHELKVYFTHGHLYSVKLGLNRLLNYAYYNEINIVCFGHTHTPYLKELNDILFLNPGSLSSFKMHEKNSYAILEIDETSIRCQIKTLKGEIIKEYSKNR
jgi:putative phosphoesterase